MSKNDINLQLESRNDQLWKLLNPVNLSENSCHQQVPISPQEFKNLINGIDDKLIVSEFKEELLEMVLDMRKEHLSYEAMVFSWYYDGYDIPDKATGKAFEICSLNNEFLFSNGSLERENPEFSGQEFYLGYLSTDRVMNVWYELEIERFEDLDEEIFIKDLTNNLEYDINEVYQELFMLKLVSLLRMAYQGILEEDKPKYLMIKTHDRWPILVINDD